MSWCSLLAVSTWFLSSPKQLLSTHFLMFLSEVVALKLTSWWTTSRLGSCIPVDGATLQQASPWDGVKAEARGGWRDLHSQHVKAPVFGISFSEPQQRLFFHRVVEEKKNSVILDPSSYILGTSVSKYYWFCLTVHLKIWLLFATRSVNFWFKVLSAHLTFCNHCIWNCIPFWIHLSEVQRLYDQCTSPNFNTIDFNSFFFVLFTSLNFSSLFRYSYP